MECREGNAVPASAGKVIRKWIGWRLLALYMIGVYA